MGVPLNLHLTPWVFHLLLIAGFFQPLKLLIEILVISIHRLYQLRYNIELDLIRKHLQIATIHSIARVRLLLPRPPRVHLHICQHPIFLPHTQSNVFLLLAHRLPIPELLPPQLLMQLTAFPHLAQFPPRSVLIVESFRHVKYFPSHLLRVFFLGFGTIDFFGHQTNGTLVLLLGLVLLI